MEMHDNQFLRRLEEITGKGGILVAEQEIEPYLQDQRGRYHGKACAVAFPSSTEQVAEVVRLCRQEKVSIVPQGGNTSLVGGSVPDETGKSLILSFKRMNRVRAIDADNFTLTAEAGCILQDIQEAAAACDRLFPLSLGAEGSCQIGGNLSSNAGGVQVLRYGNARELVLGLEVVLADGRIWNGLRGLRKDNTGYDLKQLFIGAEGTLGIITAAVLKLYARPREVATALVAVPDPAAAVRLLGRIRAASGESVTSFELMCRRGLEFAERHVEGGQIPLDAPSPWYVLVELFGGREGRGLHDTLEESFSDGLEENLLSDAVIAGNETQRHKLWRLREGIVEAQKFEGASIKHDVSVPVSEVPAFIEKGTEAVLAMVEGARPVPFGHVGDGNIHFNITQPEGMDPAAFLARWTEVNARIHDIVVEMGGSISAEHGIGQLKRTENMRFKSEVEIDLMRTLKNALDPEYLLNPGKVI
ncbi:FAD-binding oxidoreductase [Fodinicurvata fenggangensis]|uniref:FAD-binding oxidoreductase n=1 Tax=Fodinicurvata fenggangensis TaxID=1121830 RepID=UPI000479693A|nr:FAD-binding oxidoreductase [Fodinicurvata fenggangensis]